MILLHFLMQEVGDISPLNRRGQIAHEYLETAPILSSATWTPVDPFRISHVLRRCVPSRRRPPRAMRTHMRGPRFPIFTFVCLLFLLNLVLPVIQVVVSAIAIVNVRMLSLHLFEAVGSVLPRLDELPIFNKERTGGDDLIRNELDAMR